MSLTIHPYFMGGLANQLFQLAATEAYAKKTGRQCILHRNLHQANPHSAESYLDTIFADWRTEESSPPTCKIIREDAKFRPFAYERVLEHYASCTNVLLVGYWQNHALVTTIRDSFIPRLRFDTSSAHKYPQLCTSAFLHVRGGDYVNHPFHDVKLDVCYYSRAISEFPVGTHFYVFTNDVAYAESKPYLKDVSYTFVNENEVTSMYLMSQCAVGGICANSSFSWWGAYLNPNRILCMPDKWFNDPTMYTEGYYFEGVRKIPVGQP